MPCDVQTLITDGKCFSGACLTPDQQRIAQLQLLCDIKDAFAGGPFLPLSGGTVAGPFLAVDVGTLSLDASALFKLYTPGVGAGSSETGGVLRLKDDSNGEAEYVPLQVDNVAWLKALPAGSVPTGWLIHTRGYYTDGDGGEGVYRYDSSSAATANDGTVIDPTYLPGRFLLLNPGSINLRQFGAKGDGSTDDTTALTNALSYLNTAGGGVLFVPRGTFKLTNGITVANSNLTISGTGPGSTIRSDKTDGTNNFLFTFTGSGVRLANLRLARGSNANPLEGVADKLIILNNTVVNWEMSGCEIDGNMTGQIVRGGYYYTEIRSSGLNGNNPDGILIQGCYFTDCGNRALDLRGVRDATITNNRFWRCGVNVPGGNPGTCVEIQSYDLAGTSNWSYNVVIADNLFQRWGDGAINCGGTSDMTITGNVCEGASVFGEEPLGIEENAISIFGGILGSPCRIVIDGNVCTLIRSAGIQVRTSSSSGYLKDLINVVVSNNSLYGGTTPGGAVCETGIQVYGIDTGTVARGITVTGNALVHTNNAGSGIALSTTATGLLSGVVISSNVLYGASNAGTGRAISSSSTPATQSNVNIVGNQMDNYSVGIYSATTLPSSTAITGNTFGNCTTQISDTATPTLIVAQSHISVGATHATAGNLRLPNATSLRFRNAANSGNVTAVEVTSSDEVQIGTYLRVVPTTAQIQFSSTGKLIVGSASQTPAAGGTITPSGTAVRVSGSGAAVTLGATAISNGDTTGQYLILIGTSDTNTVTVNDASNTNLAAGSRTLGLNDILTLIYVSGQGWNEVSFSNN